MIRTCFRPSDDHAKFPFNIPANAYAVIELRRLAALLKTLGDTTLNPKASTLASVGFRMRRRDYPVVSCAAWRVSTREARFSGAHPGRCVQQVDAGIQAHGVMNHPVLGKVYAYEVDGFGNQYFMVRVRCSRRTVTARTRVMSATCMHRTTPTSRRCFRCPIWATWSRRTRCIWCVGQPAGCMREVGV